MLKNILRKWNTEVFGNIFHAVENAQKHLEEDQSKISIEGYNDSLFCQEIEARNILNRSLRNQENFLREKSRVRWAKERDKNMAYYHSLLRI